MEEDKYYDGNGNEVFPVVINTIAPIQYADEARQIAYYHMISVEGAVDDQLGTMLNTNLGPVGVEEVTHVFCSRNGFTHQLALELNTLSAGDLDWVSGVEYTVNDDPNVIKSKFCCITGDTQEILQFLGLEIK